MHKQESSALNITRFIMSIGIVFLHSYTSVQMYPSLGELTVYQQITRVLSMQFGEMAVPTFFLISGVDIPQPFNAININLKNVSTHYCYLICFGIFLSSVYIMQ